VQLLHQLQVLGTLSHHRHTMLLGPCMLIQFRSITLSSYIVAIWCKIYAPMVCWVSLDTEPRVHSLVWFVHEWGYRMQHASGRWGGVIDYSVLCLYRLEYCNCCEQQYCIATKMCCIGPQMLRWYSKALFVITKPTMYFKYTFYFDFIKVL